MGGKFPKVCAAIKNVIANLAGMLCGRAKPPRSVKITLAVLMAMISVPPAMREHCAYKRKGIVSAEIDLTPS